MFKHIMRLKRLLLPILATLALVFSAMPANATKPSNPNNWTLTNSERAAFLEYYAPVIFKRGNGNKGDHGKDWITNFDFDRDYVFSDNKNEWRNIRHYIDAAKRKDPGRYSKWEIRPTLYTYAIEYMDSGQKNLVLMYHVYHGLDKNAENVTQIHDWERIEIHISNVSSVRKPGFGESIKFAVATQHARSVREYPWSKNFNVMTTNTGKHLMIFQAEWSRKIGGIHGQELRFVEDSWSRISSDMRRNKKAEVEINGTSNDKNVHYAFAPNSSSGAVRAINARVLNYQSAPSLTSYYDNDDGTKWSNVPRIQYELQDLADIIPTHWSKSNWQPHWTEAKQVKINVVTPFLNRDGEMISGLQTFNTKSLDPDSTSNKTRDKRGGYPGKMWLWGMYQIRDVCGSNLCTDDDFKGISLGTDGKRFQRASFAATQRDMRGRTRTSASQDYQSAGSYYNQHDYFIHTGAKASNDGESGREIGFWLPKGWHLAANGGHDGRWVGIFDDKTGPVTPPAPTPLALSVSGSPRSCSYFTSYTATASGGTGPYTHQWKVGNSIEYSVGGTRSTYTIEAGLPYTVTIRDSKGATQSRTVRFNYYCNGGPRTLIR